MSEIGIGVIGCGAMGRVNVRHLLKEQAGLKLIGIVDPDPKAAGKLETQLGEPVRAFDTEEQLLACDEIDWVIIASLNSQHAAQTIAAFNAGKHVFCQKPLALNLEDCLAMREAQRRNNRQFNIGFTLRYSPHYRRIRALIDEGVIGDIVSMDFNETLPFNHGGFIMGDWRREREVAGTFLLEKCCHDIDLANWMTGARVSRVASFGGLNFFVPENEHHIARLGKNKRGQQAYRTWQDGSGANPFSAEKSIVDNQVAILEYESGVRACFHINANAGIPERRMYILGTEGAIRADVLTGSIEAQRIGFETQIEQHATGASGGHGDGDKVWAAELAATMLQSTPPVASIEEGLAAAVTCFAIDKAMESGTVEDMAAYWQQVEEYGRV
ncbi:MAG: Gfo/Idh/MocA family oxidoreductase [Pseudomonadota bacterium]